MITIATDCSNQKPSMETKRLRKLTLKIFKTINDLIPNFRKSIFPAKLNARVRPIDILVKAVNLPLLDTKALQN